MIPKGARLSAEQKEKLAEHAKTYSKRHVATMRYWLLHGKSFDEAHERASKKQS